MSGYGWNDLARDLALTTHLTISQTISFTMPLRDTALSPADCTEVFRDLLNGDPERQAYAILRLLKLAP